ncbi:GAF domain-containing protein [Rhodopseudomonas sp. P2A-2r]|uniref:GAF domain-containing protein n=1 Tax=Rhodopseudomonas sp. P2A-2r TaxID=2991972 RepID=UPI0022347CE3|nr:GAF domain-containing protein [Rhodopseudomonas sp. P2A-2r]UZE46652.1 GAF domain-containing protein [Rhodopseudomonas sp. P2A-2r]
MTFRSSVDRHAAHIRAAIESKGEAHSSLVASWKRSLSYHKLDPGDSRSPLRMADFEIARVQQALELLIRVAQPVLDRISNAVADAGACIVLSDSQGFIVDRRGKPPDDEFFKAVGLWPGSIWTEGSEGTNGIGTCIIEQRPVTILRDQHYLSRNSSMSCTTAPIFDHVGKLVATIDASSHRLGLKDPLIALLGVLVADAARQIEAELFRLAFPRCRIIVAPVLRANALLAVNSDDLLAGATRAARVALKITQATLDSPKPVALLIDAGGDAGLDLGAAELGVLHRALAKADGNVSSAARALGISRATLHRKLKRNARATDTPPA